MRVVHGLEGLPRTLPRSVLTIGNFDGVHLGHQSLMRTLVARAAAIGGSSLVLTFDPHPLQVLAPDNAPRQIQTLSQKLAALAALGIDVVVVLPFTRDLAHMGARGFVTDILVRRLQTREIHVGASFAFGHRREGSFNLLKEMGEEFGFVVEKIHQVQFRGTRVSSTLVRQALISGQAGLARRFLGRPFALEGEIVHGAAVGTSLTVPTANLLTRNELIPRTGVYVTFLDLEGRRWKSVTNIGTRPTLTGQSGGPVTVETHVLDFEKELYGARVCVEFLVRVREERRFESTEALVSRIKKDVATAHRFFEWVRRVAPGCLSDAAAGKSL
jgi:riboflavin kinase / FMN adenylyltransferase